MQSGYLDWDCNIICDKKDKLKKTKKNSLQKITNFDIELYRVSGKTFNTIKAMAVETIRYDIIAALDQ